MSTSLKKTESWKPLFDPLYWVSFTFHTPFYIKNLDGMKSKALEKNIIKHEVALWCIFIISGLGIMDPPENSSFLLVIMAGSMIAWYSISAKEISRQCDDAFTFITLLLFIAWWSASCIAAVTILKDASIYRIIAVVVIMLWVYIASVLYDTADTIGAASMNR